jgi:PAS domain S-box-containing protein
MVVEDMRADERFKDNPLVTGPPHVRFYAGQPLRAPSGHKVGTLCVLDVKPRSVTREELDSLCDLAHWAESELATAELGKALSARRESEELVRAILGGTVEGILGIDLDGSIMFANPAASRMLGWSERELIGRRAHDVMHHSHADGTPFPWAECPTRRTTTHGEVVHLEDVFWRRDGSSFPCESLTAPLRRDGELVGAVSSFMDVRQRREIDRLKDEFASVVGHELRTPLTSIRASLGLLGGGVLGELPNEAGAIVETAIDNTDRLVRLINEILDLERLDAGPSAFEIKPRRLADLVRDAVAVVESMAGQGDVVIDVEVGDELVHADQERVVQALVNLLGNAIKFSPRGERVAVTASRQDGDIVLSVSDRGRGVPLDQQEAIFDRFVQVDGSDARDRGGTGLGLAIARRIVEGHGGRIWVTSVPGEGATLSFTLPVVEA